MKLICLLAMVLHIESGTSQISRSALSGTYMDVGTYSRHFKDAFSFTSNQAALSGINQTAAGIYSERKFMLKELTQFSAAISIPCFSGGAGLTADYTGLTDYNESHTGIAYGRSLGNRVDLGIQFNYNRISITGYGSAGALTFEIGTILHLTDKLHMGCHIYNPVGGKFGEGSEKLASVYSLGTGYEASDKLFLCLEILKSEKQPVNVNVAVQYVFVKQFFIRGGVACASGSYFAGTSFYWKNLRADIAANWHPQAGLTPSMAFIFNFAKIKTEAE